jgi:DNA-binding XRE family transcriptional regulator
MAEDTDSLARILREPSEISWIDYSVSSIDKFVALTQYIDVIANGRKDGPGENGLYNRISVLRAERNISRQQLADAVGVNYQTIGFLERGDYSPSLKLAFGLSEVFGLPVEAIFSTRPFQTLSEQVYGMRGTPGNGDGSGQGMR